MGQIFCYRLKQLIATGSFAEVWHAEKVDVDGMRCGTPSGDDIAVKIGRCHYDDDRSQREQQMVLCTAPFELDGFIRILDVGPYHDRLVVAMELATDNLLGMARNGLSLVECARYVGEAATALDSLHSRDLHGRRLIHGGINPTDILIRDGHAKLADLGPYPIGPPTSIPFYKAVCMAPELSWRPVPQPVPQSDQYALAATYAWLRLREGAFAMPRGGELVGAIEISRLPEPEKQVVLTAMNPQPKERFPSCCAFVEALRRVFREDECSL